MNLSKDPIRESHGTPQNPGAGGWPTIRYFNKETGYGGKSYEKKTQKAMCDELGSVDSMRQYVLGSSSLGKPEPGTEGLAPDEEL